MLLIHDQNIGSLISPPHEIARWLEIWCVTLSLENFNIGSLTQFYNFFSQHNYTRVRQTTRVGNRLEDSWLAHAHQKNYTNKYSLHFSHLIPPPLNQASRVIGTINFDENSCIISNNSIFLGKVVVVKKKSITFYFLIFFSTIVFFCYLLS